MESFVAIGFPWDIGPGSASAVFKGCLVQLPALARAMLVLREPPGTGNLLGFRRHGGAGSRRW